MLSSTDTIESEEMANHYKTIAAFFDAFPLPDARKYITSSLKAATHNRVWQRSAPVDLIYFNEKLEELLAAAFSITLRRYKREQAVNWAESKVPDITQYHLYCGWQSDLKAWHFFPRHLSIKEYFNPYKALKKITTWKDEKSWKHELETILHYALGTIAMATLDINMDVLKVSLLLQKMVEACHLIDVRTNNHKKNKMNGLQEQ